MRAALLPEIMVDSIAKRNASAQAPETAAVGQYSSTGRTSTDKQEPAPQQVEYRLYSPRLPLAVYREVAAHLRQIEGVFTGLLPQTSTTFDYLQSQVGGLWIRYSANAEEVCESQIEAILTYYGDRYGNWETLSK